jgi:hypothetical protein
MFGPLRFHFEQVLLHYPPTYILVFLEVSFPPDKLQNMGLNALITQMCLWYSAVSEFWVESSWCTQTQRGITMISNIQHSSRNCHRTTKAMPSLGRDLPRPLRRIDYGQRGAHGLTIPLLTVSRALAAAFSLSARARRWEQLWIWFVGCYMLHTKYSSLICSSVVIYTSGIQTGVRVPPGVGEDILGLLESILWGM